MADDDTEDGGGGGKSSLLKILILVLVFLLILVGAVGGTLYFTGFFDKKEAASIEDQLDAVREQAAAHGSGPAAAPAGGQGHGNPAGAPPASGGAGDKAAPPPQRVAKNSPQMPRFEHSYLELERELLANIAKSRKVMQVRIALMTRYDERVFQNVKKHEFALRSAMLDVMRQVSEEQTLKPDFRKHLAEALRTEINVVLEKFEDFGGVEEVYFTTFVIQ